MELTLTLPDALAESLRKQAAEQGCTVEELVEKWLFAQNRLREIQKLRMQLKPHFEEAGVFTDDDLQQKLG